MTRRKVHVEDPPMGCVFLAFGMWLIGLLLWLGFWALVIVVLWKLATGQLL